MYITDVLINYLREPLGIDTPFPAVSWRLQSTMCRDRQTAYRMQLYTQDMKELVHDTGKIRSDETLICAMRQWPLQSHGRYILELTVWDRQDLQSVPFTTNFSMGFLDDFASHASWITQSDPIRYVQEVLRVTGALEKAKITDREGLCHAMYLRKSFFVKEAIQNAVLYICGLGFYHTYVNGTKVGHAMLDPAQTDYHTGALYSTYDVTRLLNAGFNAWMIILGNGRHVKAYGYDSKSRCIALLRITTTKGSVIEIPTDCSWQTHSGPIKENSIYEGETYDANDELIGWESPDFDTSTWKTAVSISGYPLSSQMLLPIAVTEKRHPLSITASSKGNWIIDFGQNMSALVQTTIHHPRKGQVLTLRFSELLNDDGSLLTATSREANTVDQYLCAGRPHEVWLPSFTYHGFRYAELSGYPAVPDTQDIVALVIHTDLERSGCFSCSFPLFNQIHRMINWSQRSNVMGIPTDCPQREERMGWLGDVQLVCEQAVYNFDMAAFYRKYLQDIKLSQKSSGELSDVTPPYWPLYPADPAWGSAYATLLWILYEQYGDREVLQEHYVSLQTYIDYLFRQTENGLLHGFGKYGDWCPPASTFPKQTPIDLTSSWFLYKDTLVFSRIAAVLQREEDAELYRQRAQSICTAFNQVFDHEGQYATNRMSPIDNQCGMTSQVLPLALDMVPAAEKQKAFDLLVHTIEKRFDFHVDTGIVGTRYLFDVLDAFDRQDIALRILSQRTYPSWGYMVEMGATTVWERWEYLAGMGMNSHNHIMFGSIDTWFYCTLCGLKRGAPRWREIIARPYIPESIQSAGATIETPIGKTVLKWSQTEDTISIETTVPVGSLMHVDFSLCPPYGTVTLEGKTIDATLPVDLESGSYHFLLKRRRS